MTLNDPETGAYETSDHGTGVTQQDTAFDDAAQRNVLDLRVVQARFTLKIKAFSGTRQGVVKYAIKVESLNQPS